MSCTAKSMRHWITQMQTGARQCSRCLTRDQLNMPGKRGNRRSGIAPKPHVRLGVPAQPVDATPSNALIRQCFPGRSDLFGCPRSKPSQGSVPADLTLASDLAFVFNASRVRLECCVDPLRPPDLSGTTRTDNTP